MMGIIASVILAAMMIAIVLFVIYGPEYHNRHETRLRIEAYLRQKELREQKKENKTSIYDFVEWKRQRDAMRNFVCALDERDRWRDER